MDKVLISGLSIDSVIGIYDWEKQITQTLVLDLEMLWDNRQAGKTDDYQHALCYESVSNAIIELVQAQPIELVEAVAERVAELVITKFNVAGVKVRVNKPGAIKSAASVGVEITRGQWH
ncbi:dihydroneopterin aldolase [Paraferrimonas sp. SM1919]|uniref:dihydroneopterin aldolase n=1 Tax=Paraferrimonas sp. SM1919 TaxID=2662263 RepID=UPI0013D5E344|nr:dihydroneopterin aldolase [Paraferrimonas sp. SM1919]